jgi:disulfide bond formation protein DsbB
MGERRHIHAMDRRSLRLIALSATLACGLALAVAHGAEEIGGLVPCALCVWERWPYRLAALVGVLAVLAPPRHGRTMLTLMGLILTAGAALGFVHVGVEFGWWPSPLAECVAPKLSIGSIADRLASMPARPAKPCDDPVFLIQALPLSMAAMNMLYSLTLAALVYALARGRTRLERRRANAL